MYTCFSLVLVSLWISAQVEGKREYSFSDYCTMSVFIAESASSCQVYPSELAYHRGFVYRTERDSVNCSQYPFGLDPFVRSEDYIHCNGTPLRLTDSDFGSQHYTTSDYYVWPAETRSSQLLFIFPTRVNLTTITLHYYHTSDRGLPSLRFWAVPDDFDVWAAPAASYRYVEVAAVPAGGEPAGHRNVSIGYEINTKKILLVKFGSTFSFALSEVEFIKGNICESTSVATYSNAVSDNLSTTTASYIQTTTSVMEHKSSETSEFINL